MKFQNICIIVDISDEDKLCPQCGTGLELIGKETISHEIEYIPAQVKVKKYVSLHYGCATVYTMVEMAKVHNLNIYKYLSFLLEQRPSSKWTDDQFEKLAPWSSEVQALFNNN